LLLLLGVAVFELVIVLAAACSVGLLRWQRQLLLLLLLLLRWRRRIVGAAAFMLAVVFALETACWGNGLLRWQRQRPCPDVENNQPVFGLLLRLLVLLS
jgi:hypothetical protein